MICKVKIEVHYTTSYKLTIDKQELLLSKLSTDV